VDNFAGSSALIVDNVSVAAIPEPSAFAALAGFAALGLVALRRRTRAA
jgi:MYXO-CTERM domain-containing protein